MKGLRVFVRGGAARQTHRTFIPPAAEAPSAWQELGDTGVRAEDFVDDETPAGAVNDVNDTFALASTPSPVASLRLYVDGVLQQRGTHYTLAGTSIVFDAARIPQTGSLVRAYYRK